MNRKHLVKLIQEQRPEPPVGFETRIEQQLDHLTREEQNMKKRYKYSTVLVAAILMTALLAGAAFAASELQLFKSLFSKTSVNSARERVVTELGTTANTLASLCVEEAVYDGKSVAVLLRIVPSDAEHYAMLSSNWGLEDMSEEDYSFDFQQNINGFVQRNLIGRKDGKQILFYSPVVTVSSANISEEIIDTQTQNDGSALIWIQYTLDEVQAEDTIECTASAKIHTNNSDASVELTAVSFELTKKPDERSYTLTPVEGTSGERFNIVSSYITFAKVAAYLTVDYNYIPESDEDMGIQWYIIDDAGNQLAEELSSTIPYGNNLYRQQTEVQTLSEIPQNLYLEAKVIGKNKSLGRVPLTLTEISNDDIPDSPALVENIALSPTDSWYGSQISLTEGAIKNGNTLELTFTYSGDAMDIAKSETVYKNTDGDIIGSSITKLCVIKTDCYTLTETLDISYWPSDFVIEFTLNGNIIDSFKCKLVE